MLEFPNMHIQTHDLGQEKMSCLSSKPASNLRGKIKKKIHVGKKYNVIFFASKISLSNEFLINKYCVSFFFSNQDQPFSSVKV